MRNKQADNPGRGHAFAKRGAIAGKSFAQKGFWLPYRNISFQGWAGMHAGSVFIINF